VRAHLQRVLDKFPDAVRSGKGHDTHCPAHSDRHRSLTISMGTKNPDAIVIACGAGCEASDILAAVGLSFPDLFPDHSRRGAKVLRTFNYTDEAGTIESQTRRIDRADGKFLTYHPVGDRWVAGRGDGPRRLYRLASLVAEPDIPNVWITEGERDADTLAETCGVLTTTVASASWQDVDLSTLAGRYVVVVIDNDRRGWTRGRVAAKMAESAGALVCDVWRPLDSFKDATEAIRAGKDCNTGFVYGVDLNEDGWLYETWPSDEQSTRPLWRPFGPAGQAHYAIAPTALLLDERINPLDKLVFLLLDEKAGMSGEAKASQQQIADAVGVDRMTIGRSIKRLREHSWIAEGRKRMWTTVHNSARRSSDPPPTSNTTTATTPSSPTNTPYPRECDTGASLDNGDASDRTDRMRDECITALRAEADR